jgi:sulfate adenylyltransferase
MTETIRPHGGELIDLLAAPNRAEELLEEARNLPKVALGLREAADLEMLAIGAMSPLTGFLGEKDYRAVIEGMRLDSGLVWSLPITLSLDEEAVKRVGRSDAVALTLDDRPIAVLHVEDTFRRDREIEAEAVFRTTDRAHPGVAALDQAGDWLVGGPLEVIEVPEHDTFTKYRMTPAETRRAFAERGWRRVVGFQTRNPVHRAHEYIQKCALEIVDGLLVHPLMGATKSDDVPVEVRVEAYRVLTEGYYPADRVVVSAFPAAMRYAGPREAIWHAICRKNYGCSHFIVGRDHAGVGSYYGTYDAQLIFDDFEPHELDIEPMFFEHSFWCKACGQMATAKTCPHGGDDHVFLSGTKVRELLANGELPPEEFTRPEVAEILIEAYRS